MVRLPSRGVETLRLGKGETGEEFVRTLTEDGVYRDGAGLYLYVTNGGKGKCWLYRYTFDGKSLSMTLGTYRKGVTLETARNRVNEASGWLYEGDDPKARLEKERQKRKIEAGQSYLVSHFIAQYIEDVVNKLPPKARTDAEAHCDTILKKIGPLPAKEVKPRQAVKETGLFDLWDGPQRAKARALRRHLFGVFNYAQVEGAIDQNPIDAKYMKVVLPRKKHDPKPADSIPFEDVPRFLARLREEQGKNLTKALMLEMIIFSSVRSGEVRLAKWKEIKGDVWEVPPEPGRLSKGAKKMRPIPLTRPMMAALKQMQARRIDPSDNEAYIFPPPKSPHGRGKPFPASELSTFVNKLKWEKPVRPHGFRFTLKDWAATKTRDWDVLVERQQDRSPEESTAASIRYTDLVRVEARDRSLSQRRKMMDAYADEMDPPRTADNVIQFQA